MEKRLARPTTRQLVDRILGEPALARAIRALEPRVLARLVERVGLEDAGEIVALATTDQLVGLFDEDLWRSARPGQDEAFDAARFATWLEVLLEAGERAAARRLVELPEELLLLALQHMVLVVDLDALAVEMADRGGDDEADRIEKALEGALHVEIDRFRVLARRAEGWDALAAVLTALDEQDHALVERLLDRLASAAVREIDDQGGLSEALDEARTIEADAAADREDRRARAGYVAPSQAAAFLALARRDGAEGAERDPITRAYFRELERRPTATARAEGPVVTPVAPLAEILRDAEALPAPARRLAGRSPDVAEGPLRRALAGMAHDDPAAAERFAEELAYLVNALVAGHAHEGRALRPLEAADVALAACEIGLGALGGMSSADRLFRAGWKILGADRDAVKRILAAR